MSNAYIFPFGPRPQRLSVALLGSTYNLRTRWSVASDCWLLDIADEDNNPLVGSIALVTGVDLLGQYQYVDIGGGILVQMTSGPPDTVPGYADLGVNAQVFFLPYASAG